MTGLVDAVAGNANDFQRITVKRRNQFRNTDIFLPEVPHKDGNEWIELNYSRHILPVVDWDTIQAPDMQSDLFNSTKRQYASVDVGDAFPVFHDDREVHINQTIQEEWFTRRLSDVVPNPWQAARIVLQLMESLRSEGESNEDIYDKRSYLSNALWEYVTRIVEEQAEQVFRNKLRQGEIRFDLKAGHHNFCMLESYEMSVFTNAGLMTRNDGHPMQLSLFEPVYPQQFDSDLERKFTRYLDEQKALLWWHRVAVRHKGDYYLRGWKQERIWPDFVEMGVEVEGNPHVLVFETKGEHLRDNPDTCYKQQVLKTLRNAFNEKGIAAGTMTVHKAFASLP